ncbi:MAG: MBL fold metallo-hydrolase, partial [Candidatus Micrarchaeota archaeon]|nr:MBL fold metallo-hydrolase [Candidatus Micrarchaeota archaeon]
IIVCEPGIQSFDYFTKFKLDIKKVMAIIVSHNHLDHVNDLLRYLEACDFIARKKPIILASKNVLIGDERYDKYLSRYHAMKAECIVGESGKEHLLANKYNIRLTKMRHDEYSGFGFVIDIMGKKIGYTSDTEYFDGLADQFKGCDILIINNLKPENDNIPDHLSTNDTIKILNISKPKLAILYHLGMSMFRKGIEKETKRIEEMTGLKTIGAYPGLEVSLNL